MGMPPSIPMWEAVYQPPRTALSVGRSTPRRRRRHPRPLAAAPPGGVSSPDAIKIAAAAFGTEQRGQHVEGGGAIGVRAEPAMGRGSKSAVSGRVTPENGYPVHTPRPRLSVVCKVRSGHLRGSPGLVCPGLWLSGRSDGVTGVKGIPIHRKSSEPR